jgi:phosphate/sulfate permease
MIYLFMFTWIFITGIFISFYNAWGGGANDCANSFATAVGSKALTLKQAILIASVFEFLGALLMGSHVTNTVRKGIVSLEIFEDNPGALMYGMLCANLSSALWLTLATYLKWPVSTTHSIIGAIVGFSLAYGGSDAIVWDKIGYIVLSWFISPVLAGIFSISLFTLMKKYIFESPNPFHRTEKMFPILTFFTFFINTLFIIYKGSPQLDLDELPFETCFGIAFGISSVFALMSWFIYLPYAKKRDSMTAIEMSAIEMSAIEMSARTDSYTSAVKNHLEIGNSIDENIKSVSALLTTLKTDKKNTAIEAHHDNAFKIDEPSDKLCSWLQIFTSCFSSFAHGSNDVANAVAPLATIYSIYQYDTITTKTDVPIWILALGGFGIIIGLATWGYKIINRIGRELTKISPSRGFIIELAAAITIIIASRTEMPISTTHCQVGSVVGCGLSNGKKNINWKLLKGILFSWFITLPITGFLSAGLFSFGYYSP